METSDAVDETSDWESEYDVYEYDAYEYDAWASEYGEYYEGAVSEEVDGLEASDEAADEEDESWESSYDDCGWTDDYDYDYEYEYEYEYEYACPEEAYGQSECLDESVASEGASDETTEYGGYSAAYPEAEYAYPEPMVDVAEPAAESSSDEDFGYDYEYDAEYDPCVDDAWDYESDVEADYSYDDPYEPASEFESEIGDGLEDQSEETSDFAAEEPYGYDYADPYEYYGYDYEEETVEEAAESGLELFAWHPNDLLLLPDREILRTLETLCDESSGVRRATLNDYLEALGWEAIDFASRFEDVTGIEVLGLADDLPGAAAFLGAFRLMEQGELGQDEAVDLLERSLQNLSLEWIEGVSEITANAYEEWEPEPSTADVDVPEWSDGASAGRPAISVLLSLGSRSLIGLGNALSCVSQNLAEVDWQSVAAAAAADDPVQR